MDQEIYKFCLKGATAVVRAVVNREFVELLIRFDSRLPLSTAIMQIFTLFGLIRTDSASEVRHQVGLSIM